MRGAIDGLGELFLSPLDLAVQIDDDVVLDLFSGDGDLAKSRGIEYKATRFPWAASGRAATLGRGEGLTKMLVDPRSERVLGVGIVGPSAGEMIAEAVLAIEMAANVTDLGLTIHPHPTLSETVKEAAEIFHGMAPHVHRPRRRKPI